MPVVRAVIYYSNSQTDPDRSFERAAEWNRSLWTGAFPNNIFELLSVTSKGDFIGAWNHLDSVSRRVNNTIRTVTVFTHASKQLNDLDGLEFSNTDLGSDSQTLTRNDIFNLPVLNWDSILPSLFLHGCNTGLLGDRGWSPASAFMLRQRVETAGQQGWSYFSKSIDRYIETSPSDTEIYLRAFMRGRNGITGDGRVIPSIIFTPTNFLYEDGLYDQMLENNPNTGLSFEQLVEKTIDERRAELISEQNLLQT